MKQETITLSQLQTNLKGIEKLEMKGNLREIFAKREGTYLHEFYLFVAYFNAIPNFIHEIQIDCKKANEWFLEKYKAEVKDLHYTKWYFGPSQQPEYDEVFYIIADDLIVNFDISQDKARFLFRNTDISLVEEIREGVRCFPKKEEKDQPRITLLVNSGRSIATHSMIVSKSKLKIEQNYNDDFKEIHQIILKRLSKKNDKGLVLLHGKPGTGKTSYIRYLITVLKKNIIFLPPSMASAITNPDLMAILIDNPNSILVIEDAENIVVDRETDGQSQVSALLNISDGLLSDCLNIQIICTFNTDISKIDNALLRKGRLIASYEFKELEVEKARHLSEKIGFQNKVNEPMTLSAIYNQNEKDFTRIKKGKRIGFGVN